MTFVYYLVLGYLAAALLASGLHHSRRLITFSDIVQSHRIIPARFAIPLAILVTVFELVAGSCAIALVFSPEVAGRATLLFALCLVIGLAFALYVRQLLRNPTGIASCGCSSFAGPLTIASIIPALALLLVSLFGLTASAAGAANTVNASSVIVLPLLWGITLALLVNLLPASMPHPVT